MDLSAPHINFVLGSYAISAIVLIVLVLAVTLGERKTRKKLQRMEAAGLSRRKRSKPQNGN